MKSTKVFKKYRIFLVKIAIKIYDYLGFNELFSFAHICNKLY